MTKETRQAIRTAADVADGAGELRIFSILYFTIAICSLGYEDELMEALSSMANQCNWVPKELEVEV